MKKITIILLFIFNLSFSQEKNINFYARVINFYRIDSITKTKYVIDTLENQIRLIKMDGKSINIGFSVDYQLIYLTYKISEKFDGHRMVGITKIIRENPDYNYYLGYDREYFPIVLLLSKDNKNIILYYYYIIKDELFYKSEVLEVI